MAQTQIARLYFEGRVTVEIDPDVDANDPEALAVAILAAWETLSADKIADEAHMTGHAILMCAHLTDE